MLDSFSRTSLLLGKEAMEKIKNAKIAIFGLGGAGSYAVHAIVRCGAGKLDLFDGGKLTNSNISRQIITDINDIGKSKALVVKEQLKEINPDVIINSYEVFYSTENVDEYSFDSYDYIIETTDDISMKAEIISRAKLANVPVISCICSKNENEKPIFSDISKVSDCADALLLKKELLKKGIKKQDIIYSRDSEKETTGFSYNSSLCGMMLAQKVILKLSGNE